MHILYSDCLFLRSYIGKLKLNMISPELLILVTCVIFANGDTSVMTFNVDLSATVCPYNEQSKSHPGTCEFQHRRDRIIDELGRDNFFSDVVCLQGVWYERDAKEIIRRLQLSEKYTYSYSFLHNLEESDLETQSKYPPPCYNDTEGIDLLQLCNDYTCYSDPGRFGLFDCLENQCQMQSVLKDMSESCLGCLYHGTVRDNFRECTKEEYSFNPTGLLLLSKLPISKTRRGFYHPVQQFKDGEYTVYKSQELIQRGYLDVNVKSIGRVVCTHLTEKLGDSYIDLQPEFKTSEDKNKFEMNRLAVMLEGEEKAVLLADMGATPVLTKLDGSLGFQFSTSFNTYFGNWSDPISTSYKYNEPHCTVCCGNKFVPKEGICAEENGIGYIRDHVLLKGYDVKDREQMSPDVGRLFMGTPSTDPLSSHYGIRVVLHENDAHP